METPTGETVHVTHTTSWKLHTISVKVEIENKETTPATVTHERMEPEGAIVKAANRTILAGWRGVPIEARPRCGEGLSGTCSASLRVDRGPVVVKESRIDPERDII